MVVHLFTLSSVPSFVRTSGRLFVLRPSHLRMSRSRRPVSCTKLSGSAVRPVHAIRSSEYKEESLPRLSGKALSALLPQRMSEVA
jgi:hypothetical protein